jgi:hypothetical protein
MRASELACIDNDDAGEDGSKARPLRQGNALLEEEHADQEHQNDARAGPQRVDHAHALVTIRGEEAKDDACVACHGEEERSSRCVAPLLHVIIVAPANARLAQGLERGCRHDGDHQRKPHFRCGWLYILAYYGWRLCMQYV